MRRKSAEPVWHDGEVYLLGLFNQEVGVEQLGVGLACRRAWQRSDSVSALNLALDLAWELLLTSHRCSERIDSARLIDLRALQCASGCIDPVVDTWRPWLVWRTGTE